MTYVYVLSYNTDSDGAEILDVFGSLDLAMADERVGHWRSSGKDRYETLSWEHTREDIAVASRPGWYHAWVIQRYEVRGAQDDGTS